VSIGTFKTGDPIVVDPVMEGTHRGEEPWVLDLDPPGLLSGQSSCNQQPLGAPVLQGSH
jgi:hypothetical protein